jgi:hypothetical protein
MIKLLLYLLLLALDSCGAGLCYTKHKMSVNPGRTSVTCDEVESAVDCFIDTFPLFHPSTTSEHIRTKIRHVLITWHTEYIKCQIKNPVTDVFYWGFCYGTQYERFIDVYLETDVVTSALYHEIIHITTAPNDYDHERKDVWDACESTVAFCDVANKLRQYRVNQDPSNQ